MKTENSEGRILALLNEAESLQLITHAQRPIFQKLAAIDEESFHLVRGVLKEARNYFASMADDLAIKDELGALYTKDNATYRKLIMCKEHKAEWI